MYNVPRAQPASDGLLESAPSPLSTLSISLPTLSSLCHCKRVLTHVVRWRFLGRVILLAFLILGGLSQKWLTLVAAPPLFLPFSVTTFQARESSCGKMASSTQAASPKAGDTARCGHSLLHTHALSLSLSVCVCVCISMCNIFFCCVCSFHCV